MGIVLSVSRRAQSLSIVVVGSLLLTTPTWAQEASGIAGVVRDTSGAVLPGVTVESRQSGPHRESPPSRTARAGITSLIWPGTYSVTFTLTGFRTEMKRDGIDIWTGFTATVNGTCRSVARETITVSGAAPLVDTQNVRKAKS